MTSGIPAVTADQMREVDRLMVTDFGIDLVRMMENAGRSLAELAIEIFHPRTVVILAGHGGNGGGGMVAARHLANRGRQVTLAHGKPGTEMSSVIEHQHEILRHMDVPIVGLSHDSYSDALAALYDADLIIDALIGYGLSGPPRDAVAHAIRWANAHAAPVLSLDTPSGLDVTSGAACDPCVRAAATLTLALPKVGLWRAEEAGRLYLADISVPRLLYQKIRLDVGELFADGGVVPLAPGDRPQSFRVSQGESVR